MSQIGFASKSRAVFWIVRYVFVSTSTQEGVEACRARLKWFSGVCPPGQTEEPASGGTLCPGELG